MNKLLIILISLAYAEVIVAQDSTIVIADLDQAIEIAVTNNARLQAVMLQRQQAEKIRKTAGEIGKTKLYYSFDQNNIAENGQPLDVYGVHQTLPFPTVFSGKRKLYGIYAEKASVYYRLNLWHLKKEVSQVYYKILYRYEVLQQLKYLDSIYADFSKAAERRYEVGESTYLEKITAMNYHRQLKLKRIQAEEELSISQEGLNAVLQSLVPVVVEPQTLHKVDLKEPTEKLNPGTELNQLQVEEMQASWKLQRKLNMPDINLEYFKGLGQGENSRNYDGYSVGLDIPVWIGPYSKMSQAKKIKVDEARRLQVNYERVVSARESQLHAELEKYRQSIAYFETGGLPMADEIQNVAHKSYLAGEINFLNYIQSLEVAADSYIFYLDNLNQYNQTYLELYYLTDIN